MSTPPGALKGPRARTGPDALRQVLDRALDHSALTSRPAPWTVSALSTFEPLGLD